MKWAWWGEGDGRGRVGWGLVLTVMQVSGSCTYPWFCLIPEEEKKKETLGLGDHHYHHNHH